MLNRVTVIESGKTEKQYFKDLWTFHELFFFLAWRDILVRYKQTVFGVLWAVLRPLMAMVVFSIIFGKFAKMPSEGVPYPILVYCGMLPWQFFASAFQECSTSLITNQSLISKIYFPRLVIPVSAIVVSLVDFLVAMIILFGLMIYYHFYPIWQMILIPFFLLIAFFAALGPGLYAAAMNVKYRDFRYIIPFILQVGLYISPVGFSSKVIPGKWQLIYNLNPMVGVINGFRWSILGGKNRLDWISFSFAVLIIVVLFILGLRFFRKTEESFADVI